MFSSLAQLFLIVLATVLQPPATSAFSMDLYGVPRSGWKSPDWNWGSAVGTGHDCARICRQQYANRQARVDLVGNLQSGKPEPANFEEVKLVLGLAWQNGRWDGRDGGRGGYGEVLQIMAEAKRYEEGEASECARRLVQDMEARFSKLNPSNEQKAAMQAAVEESDDDAAQRRCSGLVLEAMGFVDIGL